MSVLCLTPEERSKLRLSCPSGVRGRVEVCKGGGGGKRFFFGCFFFFFLCFGVGGGGCYCISYILALGVLLY